MEPISTTTTCNGLRKVFSDSFCQIHFHPNFHTQGYLSKRMPPNADISLAEWINSFSLTPLQTTFYTFIFLGRKYSTIAKPVHHIHLYDAVSDLMHNWVPQRPDFKSALRVVKMVLNTQCYQYLWLTMWFHAKKSKETLKNSKSLILQCKFGSRAQKWPKIA